MLPSLRVDSGRLNVWVPCGAVLLCACAAYVASFRGVLVFDDHAALVSDPGAKSLAAWLHSLGHGLRPLLKLSYLVNWLVDGIAGFHAVNLCIHVASSILVFCVALRARTASPQSWWRSAPFWAAALFAVHPIHTEAVTYVSGRSSSLSTLFCLLSLIAFSSRRQRRLMVWVVSPLLYLAAALTKETCILLPAGLLWWEVCIRRTGFLSALRRLWAHGLVVLAVLTLVLTNTGMFYLALESVSRYTVWESLVRQAQGVTYLLSRLLLVKELCIDPALETAPHSLVPTIAAVSLSLGLCAAAGVLIRRSPAVAFGLGWFIIFIYLQFVALPRPEIINERHMYLANAGLFICAGLLVERALNALPARAISAGIGTMVAVVAILIAASNLRSLDYSDPVRLWSKATAIAPHNARAWNNLGLAWERRHDFARARDCLSRAIAIDHGRGPSQMHLRRVMERLRASEQTPMRSVDKRR